MQPLISIIIPVYKVEKYIRRCIDSVIAQTYQDWELILVDDGSPDRSGAICDEYAAKDSRISVYHKENGGVSSARNLGLDKAKGEWISFVDSDDTIQPEYIETYCKALDKDVELVFAYIVSDVKLEECLICKDKIADFVVEHNILSQSSPWCKLYNRQVLVRNKISFPLDVHMGEDGIFLTKYLNAINNVKIIDYCGYNYNRVSGSLTQRYFSFQEEWDCYKLWRNEVEQLLSEYFTSGDKKETIWSLRIGDAFNRCIQSVYRYYDDNTTISSQIVLLKSIPEDDIKEYAKYFKPLNRYNGIYKYLFVHKCFVTFVLLGRIDRLVRIVKNQIK